MKAKNNVQLFDVVLLLGAAVVFGIASFFIYLQLNAFIQTQNKIAQETQELQVLQAKRQSLLQIKTESSLYDQKLAIIEQKIPSAAEQGSLISYIRSEALQFNTQFTQMRFDAQIPQKGYVQIPMKISFEGDFAGLTAMLDQLRKGSRCVRVDEIHFSKNEQQSVAKIKAEITAIAFYMSASQ